MNMTEKEMDRIVDQIQKPIKNLDSIDAELLMLHAAFDVSSTIGIHQGRNLQEQKEHIRICFERFLEGNPNFAMLLNRRPS